MLYLSLYSGIGGLDLALEALGHTPEARVEVDPWCRSVLSAREADGSLKPAPQPTFGDVRSEEFLGYLTGLAARGTERAEDRMRMLGGDPNPFPLLLAAGVPCQIASTAGKRLGSKDPRNLWPETLDIVDKVKPEVVFFENVRGLLTLEQGKFFSGILQRLSALNYRVVWTLVRASEAGAPHLRDRVFVMGVRHGDQRCVNRLHHLPEEAKALVQEHSWPAPRTPSMFQYPHEEPRLSTMSEQRPKRLRALGNMVVPQQAVLAYSLLSSVVGYSHRWLLRMHAPSSKHPDFGARVEGISYSLSRDRLDRVDTQRVDEECEFPSFVRATKTRWFWLDLPTSPREAQVAKQDPFPSDPSQPWPTADASASNVGESRETWEARRRMLKEAHKARKNGAGNGAGTPLGIAVQPWPTATATDSKGSGAAGYSTENRHAGLTLTDAAVRGFTSSTEKALPADDAAQPWATALASDAKMPGPNGDSKREGGEHLVEQTRQSPWGTPTARDAKDGGALSDEAPTTPENGYVGRQVLAEKSLRASKGALNPNWVEQLMGLPVGWTDPTKSLPWYSGAVCADSDAGKEE